MRRRLSQPTARELGIGKFFADYATRLDTLLDEKARKHSNEFPPERRLSDGNWNPQAG